MEPDSGILLDPATAAVGLGALVGLLAATYWLKVWRSVETSGQVVKGPDKRAVRDASFLTSVALFLGCGGYLFGELVGRIN